MSRRNVLVSLALLAITACTPGRTSEDDRRPADEPEDPAEFVVRNEKLERQRYGHEMRDLLFGRQYDSLDRIAKALREQRTRWPNGIWKLRSFYASGFGTPSHEDSEQEWRDLVAALRDWTQRTGSVTSRVALANALSGYGWHARGGGYGYEVSDAGNRLYHQRLEEAARVLAGAATLPERCPGRASILLDVAKGLGWDRATYDSIFTEAIRAEPSYELYYLQRAHWLLPRWYGRKGEWEQFAAETADRIGGPEGDAVYARIVSRLADYYRFVFNKTDASWERTARGYEYLIRTNPGSLELQSQYALLAVEAEDRPRARLMFSRIGSRIDPEVWYKRESFIAARDWAAGS